MKILKDLYMVASGEMGVYITSRMDCNTYMLDCGNGELIIIDAALGEDMEAIFNIIASHGLSKEDISTVVITHAHFDHVGGCGAFKEMGAKIYVPEIEAELLEKGSEEELGFDKAKMAGMVSQDAQFPHTKVDRVLKDGEVLTIGDLTITTIHTPGHSPNSACYLVDGGDRRMLFTGDYLYLNGRIGLLNYYGSSLDAYRESAPKLKGLGVEGFFPAHFRIAAKGGQDHIDMLLDVLDVMDIPKGWDAGVFG